MGGYIGNDLGWRLDFGSRSAPCFHRGENRPLLSLSSIYKSRRSPLKGMPLDGIPCIITEKSNLRIQPVYILFECRKSFLFHGCFTCRPWFPEHKFLAFSIAGRKLHLDPVHKSGVQKSHQVKTESINMVLSRPIKHGIHNIVRAHDPLTRHIIPTS